MPDLTDHLLPELVSHRLPGLDVGEDLLYPNYAGRSILNLPDSVSRWLDVPQLGAGPLDEALTSPLGAGFRHIVLVLMDALALHRLRRWISDGSLPLWGKLAEDGLLAPLTSITPSTTSAALTSLWTGRGAARHGIAGYELWLKEYGLVANSIQHTPMSFQGQVGSLEAAGFEPEKFMNLPTLGVHLARHGVQSFAFQHQSIARSGLSRMLLREVNVQAFRTPAELWANVRVALESRIGGRNLFWLYWGEVDHLSHFYGPEDERIQGELIDFTAAFERQFLGQLSPAARGGTLFILVADHGQIATQPDPHYDLRNHPSLARRLHILPTGENRLAYLYVKPGQIEAVREYIKRTWPNQFAILDPAYTVECGLFGPGEKHPRLLERLGDLLIVAKGHAYLWWSASEDHLLGRHGGLSPEEMLVPFLAVRL